MEYATEVRRLELLPAFWEQDRPGYDDVSCESREKNMPQGLVSSGFALARRITIVSGPQIATPAVLNKFFEMS